MPGLPLVQPPPGSPGSFTWLKVHAHRAQLGCRVRGACSLQDQRPSAGGARPGRRWVPRGPGFGAGSVGPQTSLGRTAVPREPIRPARACMTQHDLAQAPTQAQRKPRLGGARVRSQAQPGPWPIILPLPLLSCLPLSGSPPLRRAHGRARPTQHGRVPQCPTMPAPYFFSFSFSPLLFFQLYKGITDKNNLKIFKVYIIMI